MKTLFRAALSVTLSLLLAAPSSAQTPDPIAPITVPPATKGELVIVTLRDGSITGDVGDWEGSTTFWMNRPDTRPTLVHVSNVIEIRSATTGAVRTLPSRSQGHHISRANKILIGIGLAIGVPMLIGAIVCGQYRNGCYD